MKHLAQFSVGTTLKSGSIFGRRQQAVQLLLGHTKLESTVRYLGIEVDDAIEIAEQIEV